MLPSIRAERISITKGFTLVEILVVMAISMMIMTVVLANYRTYQSRTVLDNLAYSIALGIREAQVYGLSFRRDTTTSASYGIHFSSLAGSNTQFLVFEDSAGSDLIYTAGQDLAVDTFNLNQNYTISSLCGYTTVGAPCTALQALDVTYTRPNPEAAITGFTASGHAVYSYAEITVMTPQAAGLSRVIQIWTSGQISVKS